MSMNQTRNKKLLKEHSGRVSHPLHLSKWLHQNVIANHACSDPGKSTSLMHL